jgi:hypothetical protein
VANIQHLATPDPRAAHAPGQRRRARRAAAPDARGRRRAARRRGAADPASRASTAAGTPGRSAGRTPTRTASSASRCAVRCCGGARRGCTPASASCATRIPAAELAETEVKLGALLPVLLAAQISRTTSSKGLRRRARSTPRALRRAGSIAPGGMAEREHGHDPVLLVEPQRPCHAGAVADAVRARADAVCPAASIMFWAARPASMPAPPRA